LEISNIYPRYEKGENFEGEDDTMRRQKKELAYTRRISHQTALAKI